MELAYASVVIENLLTKRAVKVEALVDPTSVFLTIPENIAMKLGFDIDEVCTREIMLANGNRQEVPMIGPLRVKFGNRYCDLSALVLGDEPLFGSVPMEMMDLVLHPATQSITVNPASPYVPVALAK